MASFVIDNVMIVTMDGESRIYHKGVVVTEDDKIVYVGDRLPESIERRRNQFKKIDGHGGLMLPGMVNAHTHIPMVAFRGLGDDVPDRLKRYIFPLEKTFVDEQFVRIGTAYGICEMLLGGVTTFCNSYYFEDEVATMAKLLGMRGICGETIVNFVAPDATRPYEGLDHCRKLLKKWKGDDLILPAVSPHAPYTNDGEHLRAAHELAMEFDVPLTMHVAEMDYEEAQIRQAHGCSIVEYLESLGILDERFIAAHAIRVSDCDLDILEARRVGISHNVGANSKGAKGVAPLSAMYRRGMKVGLGTDGPMSGNTIDIITQLSLVGKIHKLYMHDRSLFPSKDIVEMATIGGARAIGLDSSIGSIEIGKKADLIILETQSVNMSPMYDPYSTVVYAANPGNVDIVIVNGRLLVKDKQLVETNFNEIRENLLCLQTKIARKICSM